MKPWSKEPKKEFNLALDLVTLKKIRGRRIFSDNPQAFNPYAARPSPFSFDLKFCVENLLHERDIRIFSAGKCRQMPANLYTTFNTSTNMLEQVIKKGESEIQEFKESLSDVGSILKSVVAFINAQGGTILVGVKDNGEVVGVDIGKGTIESLTNKIANQIEPRIFPSIEVTSYLERKLIVIRVEEGFNKPYFLKQIAYKRVGKNDLKLNRDELEKIFLQKPMRGFDTLVSEATLGEASEGNLRKFVDIAREERKMDITFTSTKDMLKKLGMVKNIRPVNAAVLLFCGDPQKYFYHAIIKAGRFKDGEMLDEKTIDGSLRDQIENALNFVKLHTRRRFEITEEGRRKEIWEYPLEAVRELIVNALCHRAYTIPSPVYMKIYDDRITLQNPGGLLPPLTPEKLKEEHPSVLRNPLLAKALYMMGYVEQWGMGTNKVVKLCVSHGLTEPEFLDEGNLFTVVLKGLKVSELLNERQMKILKAIKKKGSTKRKELEELLRIPERTLRSDLEKFVKLRLVEKMGKGKEVSYKAKA